MPDENTISRLYQQSREEPMDSQQLDEKILAAAQADLQASRLKAKVVAYRGWRRWSTPIAAAACLLLATSLGFNVVLYQQASVTAAPDTYLLSDAPAAVEADSAVADIAPQAMSAELTAKRARPERTRRISSGQADRLFEMESAPIEEEIVVTGAITEDVSPEMVAKIDGIIDLLQTGQLEAAEQQLAVLVDDYKGREE
ncbi:hypothetical protein KFE80_12890 [bacterium SCSIO 12696]|nr:hypothetical protein KFE80_12890 [bacterium SCSIO 12696]